MRYAELYLGNDNTVNVFITEDTEDGEASLSLHGDADHFIGATPLDFEVTGKNIDKDRLQEMVNKFIELERLMMDCRDPHTIGPMEYMTIVGFMAGRMYHRGNLLTDEMKKSLDRY